MQFFVKPARGTLLCLQGDVSWTHEDLAHECGRRVKGMKSKDVRFMINGRQLLRGQCLRDLGLQKDGTVFALLRLRGGSSDQMPVTIAQPVALGPAQEPQTPGPKPENAAAMSGKESGGGGGRGALRRANSDVPECMSTT